MIQDLLTYTAVGIATGCTILGLYRSVYPKKNKSHSAVCSSCSGCALKKNTTNKKVHKFQIAH